MRSTRLGWAGLISLLIHVALLAFLWGREPEHPVSTPPEPQPHPLAVELIYSTPPPAAPPLNPPPTARTERPRSPPRALPVPRPPATRPPPPEQPSSEPSPAAPSLPLDSRPDVPLAAEARRPSLLPSLPSGDWSLPSPEEKPRGRTIRPGDPSLSPETLAAEEHARVSARVQTFAEDDLAARRVENGLVHPYFSEVREALEKQLEGAPLFKGKTTAHKIQQFVRTYLKAAERYGQSGLVGEVSRWIGSAERIHDEDPSA